MVGLRSGAGVLAPVGGLAGALAPVGLRPGAGVLAPVVGLPGALAPEGAPGRGLEASVSWGEAPARSLRVLPVSRRGLDSPPGFLLEGRGGLSLSDAIYILLLWKVPEYQVCRHMITFLDVLADRREHWQKLGSAP